MKLELTLVRSKIGYTKKIRDNLRALGLNGINSTVVVDSNNLCSLGRVKVVQHLLKIEEII